MGFARPCHGSFHGPARAGVGMKGEILTLDSGAASREIFADFPAKPAVSSPTTPTAINAESLTALGMQPESRGGGDAHGRGDSRCDGARGGDAGVLQRREGDRY